MARLDAVERLGGLRRPAARRRRRRELKRRILSKNRSFELSQRRARLDSELLYQHPSCSLVDGKRVSLPTAAIEREHQLRMQALSEWVLCAERLQLPNQVGVPSEREIGIDPLLQCREAELPKLANCRLRE